MSGHTGSLCVGTFVCPGCEKERCWCEGADDNMPELCDECWFEVIDKRKQLLGSPLLVALLLCLACGGEAEHTPAPDDPGMECVVDFRGAPCSFFCTDCDDQPDCENAVNTAVDECLFEQRNGDE